MFLSVERDVGHSPSLRKAVDDILAEFIARSLSESVDAAPRVPLVAKARQVGIPLLKDIVGDILRSTTPEYISATTTVYLVHPPALASAVANAMTALPLSPASEWYERRMLSVIHDGNTEVFDVETYQVTLPDKGDDWWVVLLFNPEDPPIVIQHQVEVPLVSSSTESEIWAMSRIEQWISEKGSHCSWQHEPNGQSTFPDFSAQIDGVEWALEVTRPLEGIIDGRIIRTEDRKWRARMAQVFKRPHVGGDEIKEALKQALEAKGERFQNYHGGQKNGLVLVNAAAFDLGRTTDAWGDQDLSHFDAVILVQDRIAPEMDVIKGALVTDTDPSEAPD